MSALPARLLELACPTCAGNQGGGAATALLIAGMIVLPFVLAAIVARIVRRAGAE